MIWSDSTADAVAVVTSTSGPSQHLQRPLVHAWGNDGPRRSNPATPCVVSGRRAFSAGAELATLRAAADGLRRRGKRSTGFLRVRDCRCPHRRVTGCRRRGIQPRAGVRRALAGRDALFDTRFTRAPAPGGAMLDAGPRRPASSRPCWPACSASLGRERGRGGSGRARWEDLIDEAVASSGWRARRGPTCNTDGHPARALPLPTTDRWRENRGSALVRRRPRSARASRPSRIRIAHRN